MRTLTHAMLPVVLTVIAACGSPDPEAARGGSDGQAATAPVDTSARGAQDPAADPHAGHQPAGDAGDAVGATAADPHAAHAAAPAQTGATVDHTAHTAAAAQPGAGADHAAHAAAPGRSAAAADHAAHTTAAAGRPAAAADHAAHTAAPGRPAAATDHAAHAAAPGREAAGELAGHVAQEAAAGGMVGGMTKLLELVNLLLEDDDVRAHVHRTPELHELHAAATVAHDAHDAAAHDAHAPAAQTPGAQQHAAHGTAEDSAAVAETVRRFHTALQSGDSATALGLLTQDVIVQESGSVETREEYRSHHLPADIAFARAVPRETGAIRVTIHGDVAWTTSTSVARGTFRDREVNSQTAELMVLVRTAAGWRISAIHWSSRTLRT